METKVLSCLGFHGNVEVHWGWGGDDPHLQIFHSRMFRLTFEVHRLSPSFKSEIYDTQDCTYLPNFPQILLAFQRLVEASPLESSIWSD